MLAHPECTAEVLAEADRAGSTAEIIRWAEESDADELIILTVAGVLHELKRRCPGKRFLTPATTPRCPDMELISLEGIASALRGERGEVTVAPAYAAAAKSTLDAMLAYAGRN